jgi:hypothetical protein
MKTTNGLLFKGNIIKLDTAQYKKNRTDISTALKTFNLNNGYIEKGLSSQRSVRTILIDNVR